MNVLGWRFRFLPGGMVLFCLLITLCGCLLPQSLEAQAYRLAAGARLGTDVGLTAKYRVAHRGALEGILQHSLYHDQSLFTVLYEQHSPIISRRFTLYGGGGLHTGLESTLEGDRNALFGITAIGGVELTLGRVNVSYDFKPVIHLAGSDRIFNAQTAISVRYVFIKNPKRPWFGPRQDRYKRGEEPIINLPPWWPQRGN